MFRDANRSQGFKIYKSKLENRAKTAVSAILSFFSIRN